MFDSTARAERIDLSTSESVFYTWEVAQKPLVVRLPLPLIDRLESEVVETFRSLTSRGSEIGGLLLGSVAQGSPSIVTVADFELIPCDYSRGPLYRLSDADLGRYEQAIEKHASTGAPRVVGYFRSHTRKGLALDAEDISFFESRLVEPQQFVLLVRPFATKASSAGIFIRENGHLGETSLLEFPFRSSELGTGHSGEKAEPAGPAASASQSSKSQARAQIVPIASRREISLPEPAASTPPAPIVADRVELAAPAKTQTLAQALDVEKPSDKPAPEAKSTPERRSAADSKERKAADSKSATESNTAPEVKERKAAEIKSGPESKTESEVKTAHATSPLSITEIPAAPAGKNKKLRLIVAAAIAMLALVAGGLVVYPALRQKFAPRTPAVQQDSSPLSLRVERTSGGMLLTWNRDLPSIQGATKVMLSITDGDRHQDIPLDPNQVRTGSILYPPMTGDVSFQMEVTDRHQAKTTSESLRVLDPRPSPLADPADANAAAKPNTPAKPGATTTTPASTDTATADENKAPEETAPAHSTTPLRAFNTESLAQRLRPVTTTDLPDAPSVGTASTSSSLPGIVPNPALLPPPPKVAPPTPTPAPPSTPAATTQALEQGGQLKPAVVTTRVDPEYPRLARQAGASGLVILEATISADGHVKNPRVIKGNSMLQKAAVDAVLQWRYKPAMLNGKAVDSPVEIKLNFVAH